MDVGHTQSIPSGNWFVVMLSKELKKNPIQKKLMDETIVLFRNKDSHPHALKDQCPHKQMFLSKGKIKGNHIICPYHGWQFGTDGELKKHPCHGKRDANLKCRVRRFETIEQDGFIWVYMGKEKATTLPPTYPKEKKYHWFDIEYEINATAPLIMENGFDCAHTCFVHEGLFRSSPKEEVQVNIRPTAQGIIATTIEEQQKGGGFDIKTILSGRKKVVHTDQLILPNTVRVDYVQEDFYHVITILMCTPIDQNNTRVFIRMATWYAYLTWLVGPFVKHLTNKVVKQDRIILKNQYQCIDTFGRKPHIYVQADWPSKMMLKCMDLNSRGEFHPDKVKEADVSFKL